MTVTQSAHRITATERHTMNTKTHIDHILGHDEFPEALSLPTIKEDKTAPTELLYIGQIRVRRLPGHPVSPFDPTDETVLIIDDSIEDGEEYLVDAKYLAHAWLKCRECEPVWFRATGRTILDDDFTITEDHPSPHKYPYLVHTGDVATSR